MNVRTQVFVDKLSLTIPVAEEHQSELVDLFEHLKRFDNEHVDAVPLKHHTRFGRYRNTAGIWHEGELVGTVELAPKLNSTQNFARVEINPAIWIDALRYIASLFARVIPAFGPAELFRTARLTRCDLTFDVQGIAINDVAARGLLRKTRSGLYQTHPEYDKAGRLTAILIGMRSSSRHMVIYDKRLEQSMRHDRYADSTDLQPYEAHDIGRPTQISLGDRNDSGPITRVELVLQKGDTGSSFYGLRQLGSPWAGYAMFRLDALAHPGSTIEERAIAAAIRHMGAQAFLSMEANTRKRLALSRRIVSGGALSWWDPSRLWKESLWALSRVLASPHVRRRSRLPSPQIEAFAEPRLRVASSDHPIRPTHGARKRRRIIARGPRDAS